MDAIDVAMEVDVEGAGVVDSASEEDVVEGAGEVATEEAIEKLDFEPLRE